MTTATIPLYYCHPAPDALTPSGSPRMLTIRIHIE